MNPAPAQAGLPAPLQPFTFRGVAACAGARLGCLSLVALAAALVVAVIAVWFVHQKYVPVVSRLVAQLPAGARIHDGRLDGFPPRLIAQNKFLAIAFTPEDEAAIGQSADVQIQFRAADVIAVSLLRPDWGFDIAYGRAEFDLSRAALDPAWGAWRPVLLAAFGAVIVAALFIAWALIASILAPIAKFLAYFGDRGLTWLGAWKMSVTALMPGAMVAALGLALYGMEWIDLLGLACFYAGHLLVGLIYAVGAPWFAPRLRASPAANPFSGQV